jgi:hypothetical protein
MDYKAKKVTGRLHFYQFHGKDSLCGRTDDQTRQTNDPIKVTCKLCIRELRKES